MEPNGYSDDDRVSFSVLVPSAYSGNSDFEKKKYKVVVKRSDLGRLRVSRIKKHLSKTIGPSELPLNLDSDSELCIGGVTLDDDMCGEDFGLRPDAELHLRFKSLGHHQSESKGKPSPSTNLSNTNSAAVFNVLKPPPIANKFDVASPSPWESVLPDTRTDNPLDVRYLDANGTDSIDNKSNPAPPSLTSRYGLQSISDVNDNIPKYTNEKGFKSDIYGMNKVDIVKQLEQSEAARATLIAVKEAQKNEIINLRDRLRETVAGYEAALSSERDRLGQDLARSRMCERNAILQTNDEVRKLRESLSRERAELEASVERERRELRQEIDETRRQALRSAEAASRLPSIEARCKSLEECIQVLERERDSLSTELNRIRSDWAIDRNSLAGRWNEETEVLTTLYRDDKSAWNATKEDLNTTITTLREERDRAVRTLHKSRDELSATFQMERQRYVEANEARTRSLTESVSVLENRCIALEKDVATSTARLSENSREKDILERAVADLKAKTANVTDNAEMGRILLDLSREKADALLRLQESLAKSDRLSKELAVARAGSNIAGSSSSDLSNSHSNAQFWNPPKDSFQSSNLSSQPTARQTNPLPKSLNSALPSTSSGMTLQQALAIAASIDKKQ